jgi:hypothetical protein
MQVGDAAYRLGTDAPSRPEWGIRDVPIIGAFAKGAAPPRSTKYTTVFYEQVALINQAYGSVRNSVELGELDRAASIAAENKDKLALRKTMNKTQKLIGKINKRIKHVMSSRTMSESFKKVELERLQKEKNRATQSIMNKYKDTLR